MFHYNLDIFFWLACIRLKIYQGTDSVILFYSQLQEPFVNIPDHKIREALKVLLGKNHRSPKRDLRKKKNPYFLLIIYVS